jgi:4-amino-4-deoxy-L-arabinose transferase-like glycosyltransferase
MRLAPITLLSTPHTDKYLLAMILLICAALRLWPLQYEYYHPDEDISVGVAQQVVESGSLDTNWKNAALPPDFKLPQYNFSGYLLSAAAVDAGLKVLPGDAPRDTLKALRLWSALLAIAAAALTFAVGRRFFGTPTALIATLLVAINPLLAQDGFYARPEPFVTALTLALVLAEPAGTLLYRRVFLAAMIAGVLIATKVSMLALLPLLFAPDAPVSSLAAYVRRTVKELPLRAAAAGSRSYPGFRRRGALRPGQSERLL